MLTLGPLNQTTSNKNTTAAKCSIVLKLTTEKHKHSCKWNEHNKSTTQQYNHIKTKHYHNRCPSHHTPHIIVFLCFIYILVVTHILFMTWSTMMLLRVVCCGVWSALDTMWNPVRCFMWCSIRNTHTQMLALAKHISSPYICANFFSLCHNQPFASSLVTPSTFQTLQLYFKVIL